MPASSTSPNFLKHIQRRSSSFRTTRTFSTPSPTAFFISILYEKGRAIRRRLFRRGRTDITARIEKEKRKNAQLGTKRYRPTKTRPTSSPTKAARCAWSPSACAKRPKSSKKPKLMYAGRTRLSPVSHPHAGRHYWRDTRH